MARKSQPAETPRERLRKVPRWQWGTILIMAGVLANLAPAIGPQPATAAEAKGAALGKALASLLFIIPGLALVVMHLLGGRRAAAKPTGKKRPRGSQVSGPSSKPSSTRPRKTPPGERGT